jgi:hypothetical protein
LFYNRGKKKIKKKEEVAKGFKYKEEGKREKAKGEGRDGKWGRRRRGERD